MGAVLAGGLFLSGVQQAVGGDPAIVGRPVRDGAGPGRLVPLGIPHVPALR